jgi:hypothetical protein
MGSVCKPTPISLPTITLTTTLADLYRRHAPSASSHRTGFIFTGVNSALDLTPSFPANQKYLYQDTPFNTLPPSKLARNPSVSIQRPLAHKYLSLIPQRDAFIAGSAERSVVICFPVDGTEHSLREAEATLGVLDERQRPELVFVPGPGDVKGLLGKMGIDRLMCKVVLDQLEALPLTVPLDTTWFLNSKAVLARSGLPTPKAEIVEIQGVCEAVEGCCEVCAEATDGDGQEAEVHFVPASCTGRRREWIDEQARRILSAVEKRQVPFVFKNQQTFGGAGTWVVKTEDDTRELIDLLDGENGVLKKMLSRVTKKNQHLRPAAIIISDIVQNPVADIGLTFFVGETGEAVFLGASEQMCDANNAWLGSTINYPHQKRLQKKFEDLIKRTAKWLSGHGYYGAAGIDVLETKTAGETESNSGEKTAYHIVDMNVRTSGSMCLPLMCDHFTSRGLNSASSFGITVQKSRADFIRQFQKDFESGRMCIVSWYQDHDTGMSIGDLAIGAEGDQKLQEDMKTVRDMTEEVVF